MATIKFDTSSPDAFVQDVLSLNYFTVHGTGDRTRRPIKVSYNPGPHGCKLLVVTGQNATGKSMVRRCLSGAAQREGLTPIAISMQRRTEGGVVGAMMFGTEEWQATGQITGHSVIMGIKTADASEKRCVLIFDEPELGLSDEYALDAAHRIADFATKDGYKCLLVVVISHRKTILEVLDGKCMHVHLGEEPVTSLKAVINRKIVRANLEELKERSHQTFLHINAVQQRNKRKFRTTPFGWQPSGRSHAYRDKSHVYGADKVLDVKSL